MEVLGFGRGVRTRQKQRRPQQGSPQALRRPHRPHHARDGRTTQTWLAAAHPSSAYSPPSSPLGVSVSQRSGFAPSSLPGSEWCADVELAWELAGRRTRQLCCGATAAGFTTWMKIHTTQEAVEGT